MILSRVREKYTKTRRGCWLWRGALTGAGYGAIWIDGRTLPAHRIVFAEVRGPIPAGLFLDHLCRNKRCVNPSHLEPVSPATNTRRGNVAKLVPRDVNRIRFLYKSGIVQTELARLFAVGQDQISRIVNFKRWANI